MTSEEINKMIDDAILNPNFAEAEEMIRRANEELHCNTRKLGYEPTRKIVVVDFQRRNASIDEDTPWLIRMNPSARNLL